MHTNCLLSTALPYEYVTHKLADTIKLTTLPLLQSNFPTPRRESSSNKWCCCKWHCEKVCALSLENPIRRICKICYFNALNGGYCGGRNRNQSVDSGNLLEQCALARFRYTQQKQFAHLHISRSWWYCINRNYSRNYKR